MVGLVSQLNHGDGVATGYGMVAGGSDQVFLPLLYSDFAKWDSGLQVENLGSTSTSVAITFYREDGTEAGTLQDTIEARSAQTYYLPSLGSVPSGFLGSAVVKSSGQPIAVICNHIK